ncbi:MAG TPA: hypothetical protein VE130_10655 [Nitrososphaeraceae archaeon]|jgi:hypothetical protein|nr:hypothetical protein [Nitrososphaeraceae archaeon]
MTKHYPRSHYQEQRQEQRQHKDKGWYCKEHNTKYLCGVCGYDNNNKQRRGEVKKYYFVGG